MSRKAIILVLTTAVIAGLSCGSPTPDIGRHFKEVDGCFVMYDLNNHTYTRFNEKRAATRYSPCSTFKIPNSLIALETGVIPDENQIIPWDSLRDPRQDWWSRDSLATWARDHDLRSALKYSVVWYYQELARRIGEENYRKCLEIMEYGNRDISGGLDKFWLSSSMKISAEEQVSFLKNFYANTYEFSPQNVAIVKSLMVLEDSAAYRFSGKTGSGETPEGKSLGWLVGYVEKDNNVYFYALNIEGDDYEKLLPLRKSITREILKDLRILP